MFTQLVCGQGRGRLLIDFDKKGGEMGLYDGRGRWYRRAKKATVDEYLRLDVGKIACEVGLERAVWVTSQWRQTNGRQASIGLRVLPGVGVCLSYTQNGEEVPPYIIRITYTTPHYGGQRPWFVCPRCGRRVRYLYGAPFQCRTCHDLTYATRQARGADAILMAARQRQQRIEQQLAWAEEGMHTRPKPPRMHWRTYLRLLREHRQLAQVEAQAYHASLLLLVYGYVPAPINPHTLWHMVKRREACGAEDAQAARLLAALARRPKRPRWETLSLADLAEHASVPYAFAREAVRAKLLRADVGRGSRKPRYRARLTQWLRKLLALRAAGMAWAEMRAWARRRWQPGHEAERRWPAGIAASAATGDATGVKVETP